MTEVSDNLRQDVPGDDPLMEQQTVEPEASEASVTEEPCSDSEEATVDIITGEKRVTMTAPVREFEEFKDSFKAMMTAFGNFIEAAGLEIGKNETDTKVNALVMQVEQLRDELKAEEDKMKETMLTRDEFDGYKNESDEKAATAAEDYVRRSEFDRFREAIREVL